MTSGRSAIVWRRRWRATARHPPRGRPTAEARRHDRGRRHRRSWPARFWGDQPGAPGGTIAPSSATRRCAPRPAYGGSRPGHPVETPWLTLAEVDGVLQIWERDPTSPSAASPATEAAYDCKYPFWSPDGKRIYYISRAKSVMASGPVGAGGGTPQVVVLNAVRGALSPDGRTLAFLRDEEPGGLVGTLGTVRRDAQGRGTLVEGRRGGRGCENEPFGDQRFIEGALAFSPDGRWAGPFGDRAHRWNNRRTEMAVLDRSVAEGGPPTSAAAMAEPRHHSAGQ